MRGGGELIANSQLDIQDYLNISLSALKCPTAEHCRELSGSMSEAVTKILGGLESLTESLESLCNPVPLEY